MLCVEYDVAPDGAMNPGLPRSYKDVALDRAVTSRVCALAESSVRSGIFVESQSRKAIKLRRSDRFICQARACSRCRESTCCRGDLGPRLRFFHGVLVPESAVHTCRRRARKVNRLIQRHAAT